MRSRSRHLLLLLALAFGAGTILSACGQKGPLYLPDDSGGKDEQEEAQEQKKPE